MLRIVQVWEALQILFNARMQAAAQAELQIDVHKLRQDRVAKRTILRQKIIEDGDAAVLPRGFKLPAMPFARLPFIVQQFRHVGTPNIVSNASPKVYSISMPRSAKNLQPFSDCASMSSSRLRTRSRNRRTERSARFRLSLISRTLYPCRLIMTTAWSS